jgi:putative tricarboxylic transport membrane protein
VIGPVGRRVRPTALTAFLCALAVILAGYTVLAFGMEWRAPAGRLGAGFFPRVIGVLGVVLCCVAAVRSLRPAAPRGDRADAQPSASTSPSTEEGAEAQEGRQLWTLLATVAGTAVFLFLLVPLGAFLTSGLVMFALLELLGRGHLVRNAAISVLTPVILYVIFEVLLDAGLPLGPIPLP